MVEVTRNDKWFKLKFQIISRNCCYSYVEFHLKQNASMVRILYMKSYMNLVSGTSTNSLKETNMFQFIVTNHFYLMIIFNRLFITVQVQLIRKQMILVIHHSKTFSLNGIMDIIFLNVYHNFSQF